MVLTNAFEEDGVNNVIGDFLGHAEADGAVWIGCTDDEAIRPHVARFAAIVTNMVNRNLIHVLSRLQYDKWPHASLMTAAELDAALAEPATWFPTTGLGPMILMTTDHVDGLVARFQEPKP